MVHIPGHRKKIDPNALQSTVEENTAERQRLGAKGATPIVAAGSQKNIPVPIKEAAPKLLPLARNQQLEREQQDFLQQRSGVLAGIQETPTTPNPEDIRLDLRQAFGAGGTTAAAGAAGGFAVGLPAGGIGALPVAAAGAVGGFLLGF